MAAQPLEQNTVLENAAESILVADVRTRRFVYGNPAACRFLGYAREEIRRMGVEDIHPPESLPHVLSEFVAQARGEKILAPDIPCLRKDGTVVYADIHTTRVTLDGRDCNVGFFTDINARKRVEEELRRAKEELEARVAARTAELAEINRKLRAEVAEHARAEERLRQSEEKWRSLVENVPDIIITVTRDGTIQAISRTVISASVEEVIGTGIYSYISPEHAPLMRAALERVFREGRPERIDLRGTGTHGPESAWYETRIVPIERGGGVAAAQFISTDITERQHAKEEIERRNAELVRANEALRRLHEAKDEFIAMVSHELRTPLVTGLGYVELLLDGHLGAISGQAESSMKVALKNLRRLSGLIDEILEYHNLIDKESAGALSRRPFRMGQVFRECAEELRVRTGRSPADFSLDVPEGLPEVFADEAMIRQVISNLLDNVVRHAGPGARVRLSARPEADGGVLVRVSDDGEGVPAQIRDHIFEPFVKLGRSQEGSGLGLAIVRRILDAHGSAPSLRSEPGRGTEVSFALPAASSVNGAPRPERGAATGAPAPEAGPARILLVEDDPETVEFLRLLLDRGEQEVHAVGSAEEALERAGREAYDLALVDLSLPGMDGLDLCRRLKAGNGRRPRVGVLTARAEDAARIRAKEVGCDFFLAKPVPVSDLVRRVAEALAGRRAEAPPPR